MIHKGYAIQQLFKSASIFDTDLIFAAWADCVDHYNWKYKTLAHHILQELFKKLYQNVYKIKVPDCFINLISFVVKSM